MTRVWPAKGFVRGWERDRGGHGATGRRGRRNRGGGAIGTAAALSGRNGRPYHAPLRIGSGGASVDASPTRSGGAASLGRPETTVKHRRPLPRDRPGVVPPSPAGGPPPRRRRRTDRPEGSHGLPVRDFPPQPVARRGPVRPVHLRLRAAGPADHRGRRGSVPDRAGRVAGRGGGVADLQHHRPQSGDLGRRRRRGGRAVRRPERQLLRARRGRPHQRRRPFAGRPERARPPQPHRRPVLRQPQGPAGGTRAGQPGAPRPGAAQLRLHRRPHRPEPAVRRSARAEPAGGGRAAGVRPGPRPPAGRGGGRGGAGGLRRADQRLHQLLLRRPAHARGVPRHPHQTAGERGGGGRDRAVRRDPRGDAAPGHVRPAAPPAGLPALRRLGAVPQAEPGGERGVRRTAGGGVRAPRPRADRTADRRPVRGVPRPTAGPDHPGRLPAALPGVAGLPAR